MKLYSSKTWADIMYEIYSAIVENQKQLSDSLLYYEFTFKIFWYKVQRYIRTSEAKEYRT